MHGTVTNVQSLGHGSGLASTERVFSSVSLLKEARLLINKRLRAPRIGETINQSVHVLLGQNVAALLETGVEVVELTNHPKGLKDKTRICDKLRCGQLRSLLLRSFQHFLHILYLLHPFRETRTDLWAESGSLGVGLDFRISKPLQKLESFLHGSRDLPW